MGATVRKEQDAATRAPRQHARRALWLCAATLALLLAGLLQGTVGTAAASNLSILVMGDSYSAGNGAGNYYGQTGCRRSYNDYGWDYKTLIGAAPYNQPATVNVVACSGAKTSDVLYAPGKAPAGWPQSTQSPPQISQVNSGYNVVFLTIGGNDVDFADIVKYCLIGPFQAGYNCVRLLDYARALVSNGQLSSRIQTILSRVHSADPNATIVLLGYPFLESDRSYTLIDRGEGSGSVAGDKCGTRSGKTNVVDVGKCLYEINSIGNTDQQNLVSTLDTADHTGAFTFVSTEDLFGGTLSGFPGPNHELTALGANPYRWFIEPYNDAPLWENDIWYHPDPTGWAEESLLLLSNSQVPKHPGAPAANPGGGAPTGGAGTPTGGGGTPTGDGVTPTGGGSGGGPTAGGGVPAGSIAETAGGNTGTFTNYQNAGGPGTQILKGATVGVTCKLHGFAVQDGNTWWYLIASSPWNGQFYASADAFYNNGQTSGSLAGTAFVDPAVPDCSGGSGSQPSSGAGTLSETTGGVTHTFTNYSNAGGQGQSIPSNDTVQVTCRVQGFAVADGDTWWYQIASSPWSNSYYASADAFYNNGATSGSLSGTPFVDSNVPVCGGSTTVTTGGGDSGTPPKTFAETVGGETHTWTNYANAGGTQGASIASNNTVQITCRLQGFTVADGNVWWYQIASSPWNNAFYASADAFYNNGATSGSLHGTPFYDPAVPVCGGGAGGGSTGGSSGGSGGGTWTETVGGVTHTWTNYSNAGGTQGPSIQTSQSVQITCRVQGFTVADGNVWWYQIASSPWNNAYYASADAFYNNGATSGSLHGTPFYDSAVPICGSGGGGGGGGTQPPPTWNETVGGVTHTWTNYTNAGGTQGPSIQTSQSVQITCRVQGFTVADGDTWWYRIYSSPWSNTYYASADAFYNNGQTSGSLHGTPFYDPAVALC
ncbi:MAG: hypothetical protein ACLPZR_10730 [Solirubrobacteraceae bacterium]